MSEGFRYVRNVPDLLDHGTSDLRLDALKILEQVLEEVNPFEWCRRKLQLEPRSGTGHDTLIVNGLRLALKPQASVWFFGAGKASYQIARGVEDRLGARLRGGLVVCKDGQEGTLQRIDMRLADHPIPSTASVAAAHEMLGRAVLPRSGDVVICGITGGSSALLTLPCAGLELADLQSLTKILLTCGADIVEINAVRKHASQVGGGRLAMAFNAGVQLINLTVSDVIGDALDYITDPTVADTSTVDDARATLSKYGLWERVTPAVKRFFAPGGGATETPKQLPWPDEHNIVLLPASSATDAALHAAQALGYEAVVLSSSFDGESQALGRTFAAIAREIAANGRPAGMPCALIGGGETIVKMASFGGQGGPNQEFALAAAAWLPADCEGVAMGVDTDGTDGPTNIAGGLCDSSTYGRAREAGVDLPYALEHHDVSPALMLLNDAILTGSTGSNVNDLKLLLLRSAR